MNGNYTHSAAVKKIRPFDYNAVAAHKIAGFQIPNVARKQSLTGGVNNEGLTVQAKRTASANHVFVTVTVFGYVFYNLSVQ